MCFKTRIKLLLFPEPEDILTFLMIKSSGQWKYIEEALLPGQYLTNHLYSDTHVLSIKF